MSFTKIFNIVIILFFFSHLSFGQNPSITITDIQKKEFRGVRPIINQVNEEVEGYYTLYVNEKVDNKQSEFILAILDTELKIIKQLSIAMDKKTTIQSAAYNGECFLFLFNGTPIASMDLNNRQNVYFGKYSLTLVTISKKGEILGTKGIELKGRESQADSDAEAYAAMNDGFYIYRPRIVKAASIWGYSIEYVDNQLNTRWEKQFIPEKGFISAEAIETIGDKLMIIQLFKKKYMTAKADINLLAINSQTGDTDYNYPLYTDEVTLLPSCFYAEKSGIVCSGIYAEGNTINGQAADGMFFLKLNNKGEKEQLSMVNWKDGLDDVLKSTKKTINLGSKPMVLFHKIIKSKEGQYQLIGETYKVSAQTTMKAPTFLNSKRVIGDPYFRSSSTASHNNNSSSTTNGFPAVSNTQSQNPSRIWTVQDFVIFNFSEDGKITNINKIEKEHTSFTVYSYILKGCLTPSGMLQRLKERYVFDFAFSTKKKDSDQEIIVSRNFAKAKPYIGMFSIDIEEVSKMNRIEIRNSLTTQNKNSDEDFVGIMPAKPGYTCIYQYHPKERTINMYLEDIKLD